MFLNIKSKAAVVAVLAGLLGPIGYAQAQPLSPSSNLQAMSVETDRIIVKYRDASVANESESRRAQRKARRLARLERRLARKLERIGNRGDNRDVLKLNKREKIARLQTMIEQLRQDPDVEYAEPDYIMQPMLTPNDPLYNQQWHYFEPAGGMNLEPAWDLTQSDASVVVAVIDSGIRPHSEFGNRLLPGYDFISSNFISNDGDGRDADPSDTGDATVAGECGNGQPTSNRNSSWHGTHVAGTVAANGNDGTGLAGVAWGARVLPLRALGKCGGYTSDITDAMRWAAGLPVAGVPNNPNPAKVLNLSLGGTASCGTTYQQTINAVRATGATIVVAAGNESQNAANSTPANCSGVITVAASDRNGGQAYYSNFGAAVDVSAPGGELFSNTSVNGVLSTFNTGITSPGSDSYEYLQGTSMATPHVAGVVAMMYAYAGDLTPDEAEQTLKSTARAFPATPGSDDCNTSLCGAGIVDAHAALLALQETPPVTGPAELNNGESESGLAAGQGEALYFTINVPAGQESLDIAMSGGSGDADLYVRFGAEPTTQAWDHRPYLNGNNESVSIDSPQAGVWHIMVQGYTAFSGVNLVASYTAPPPAPTNEFTAAEDVQIPDNNATGVYSDLAVSREGASGSITVSVDIKHTYIGDLEIWIYAPNGASGKLKNISNDSSDDLQQSWTLNAGSIPAAGTWRLRVADRYNGDVGYIDAWTLTFN